MNRTTANVLFSALSLAGAVASQAAAPAASDASQASVVKSFVAKMVKAERALKGLRMTMETSGRMPGGLNLKTAGELRVLRGTQPEGLERRFSRLEYSFGDDVRGRMESAETAEGSSFFALELSLPNYYFASLMPLASSPATLAASGRGRR